MSFLIDSNILLRLTQARDPQYRTVSEAIDWLNAASETIYVIPQNLIEFWAVATRPLRIMG